LDNPQQPITHHWLDSTHITFGVVTIGAHNQRWKAEASVFNGRDPDESRVDLDLGAFDSVAARISYLPTENLSVQVSVGRLYEARSAFEQTPQNAANRATASATYHRPIGANGIWATTAAYGVNKGRELVAGALFDTTSVAVLVESNVTLADRHTVFGRIERVGMPAHHLHANEFGPSVFAVAKAQLGYVRHFKSRKGIVPGIGGSIAFSLLPPAFAPRYSGSVAPSYSVFFNVRPARHVM
jgi:hypothetical protein